MIGTEARVFLDGDTDVHEQMCTHVVVSGDTTMFQDIDERMPTTSAPYSMQIKNICPPEQASSPMFVHGDPAGRVIFVRAALISVEEAARISRESVPNDGCDVKEHDGSVSEEFSS